MNEMDIYNMMPVRVQDLACTLQGVNVVRRRYSRYFEKRLAQYKKSANVSYERICEYQDKKLKKLLIHSYETVPYYKKEFDEAGFDPYSFQHADQIKALPILTKDVLQENTGSFISSAKLPSKTFIHPTGGTTGKALGYYTTYNEQSEQWAVWWRYRERLGIKRTDWCGEFASKLIVPVKQNTPPYYRVDKAGRRIYFSPYHLTMDTVRDYAEGLIGVRWVHGYTSKLSDMAGRLIEAGIRIPMDHVTIGAENLYDTQRKILEEAFATKVYQHYGQTEGAANISQYPDGKLRIDEDFSYVEFVNDGKDDRIVGTNFNYYRMPLIRYATGDYATLDESQDGGFRIVKSFHGRESEYITRADGSRITAVEFDEEVFAKVSHMAGGQIVQKNSNELVIRVIKATGYNKPDEDTLLRRLRDVVGESIKYQIEYPEELEKAPNGKFKLIVKE